MYPPGTPTRDYDVYEEFAETRVRRKMPIDPTTGERYALDGLLDAIAFVRAVMRQDYWLPRWIIEAYAIAAEPPNYLLYALDVLRQEANPHYVSAYDDQLLLEAVTPTRPAYYDPDKWALLDEKHKCHITLLYQRNVATQPELPPEPLVQLALRRTHGLLADLRTADQDVEQFLAPRHREAAKRYTAGASTAAAPCALAAVRGVANRVLGADAASSSARHGPAGVANRASQDRARAIERTRNPQREGRRL